MTTDNDTRTLTDTQRASWASHFARRALTLVRNERVIRREAEAGGQLLCVAWPREDRVVLLINPYAVNQAKLFTPAGRPRERFLHDLRTVMHGHRTVVTNSRGIFFQVGYCPEPVEENTRMSAIRPLPKHVTLDLGDVPPGRLMVPLGVTRRGPNGWS